MIKELHYYKSNKQYPFTMQYYSLNNKEHLVSFQEAVTNGLAPDKGLYFPKEIPKLEASFFDSIESLSHEEIAFEVIQPYIGNEIPEKELQKIMSLKRQMRCI